jgi:nitrogen fixation protein FixH
MSKQLATISQRQITGRWMDRAFLGFLAVIITLSVSSVAMAVSAAAAPVTQTVVK